MVRRMGEGELEGGVGGIGGGPLFVGGMVARRGVGKGRGGRGLGS